MNSIGTFLKEKRENLEMQLQDVQSKTKKEKNSDADTSKLEKQIDEMVYKLYELTEEEIAIVEGKK